MKPVSEYCTVRPGLFHWQGYEPEVKCDCSSTAIVTPSGLIFIDPIPLAEDALKDLVAESFSAPAAVVLTSGNHQRGSLAFAKRYGIPLLAPADAGDDIIAGETAFLQEGVLIFGDALIHLDPKGLRPLPEKYRQNIKESLRSLKTLKPLLPKTLLFAHGSPIVQDAEARIFNMLAQF